MAREKQRKKKRPGVVAVPPPDPDDVNAYITFVLYAVTGRMAEADGMFGAHGRGIRRVAAWMRSHHPVTRSTVYRGMLLDPDELDAGRLTHQQERTFVSWTENKDVACWFAAADSIISELLVQQRPWIVSYLVEGRLDPEKVLWHHSWKRILLPGFGSVSLISAAAMHPEIDTGQFAWNLSTQKEVVTVAPGPQEARLRPKRVGSGECPETSELDARLAYPPYVAALGGSP